MKKLLLVATALVLNTACGESSASQVASTTDAAPTVLQAELPLAELTIDSLKQEANGDAINLTATVQVQTCRHDFVGLHLEDVSDRQILVETKLKVRALARDNGFACHGPTLTVEKTVKVQQLNSGFYTLIK